MGRDRAGEMRRKERRAGDDREGSKFLMQCDFDFMGIAQAAYRHRQTEIFFVGIMVRNGCPNEKSFMGYARLTAVDWPINKPDPALYLHCTKPI